MAQKVHDLVFVSAGTLGLDLTWSPSVGVMMKMMIHSLDYLSGAFLRGVVPEALLLRFTRLTLLVKS